MYSQFLNTMREVSKRQKEASPYILLEGTSTLKDALGLKINSLLTFGKKEKERFPPEKFPRDL